MSYRQSREIVRKRYSNAKLSGLQSQNGSLGRYGGVSVKTFYTVVVEQPAIVLSGPDSHKSKKLAWVAAAELIQPKPVKLAAEPKPKRYPLWSRWLKKKLKREGKLTASKRMTGRHLPN